MKNPKAEAELLMNDLVDFAEKMLNKYGEFHPFGGYLTEKGELVHIGVSPEYSWSSDKARAVAIIDSLRDLSKSGRAIACALVSNVALSDGREVSDAIQVFLEHQSGYCADVFLRYTLGDGFDVRIADVSAQRGAPAIF
jgi:hypothetical protein